jgi:outer membrane protein assembly factor BamB
MERYLTRMRRPRLIYAGAVGIVVAALVAVVAVMWSNSEVAHVTVHTVADGPPPVTLSAPTTVQRQVWQSSDRTAIGTPYWLGTAVTFSTHTVQGRNALTGAPTWSYTRSDRSTCQVIQDQGTTVAIYRQKGRCDEVTGLDTSTGARKWTRTLDENAQPIVTDPVYDVMPFTIMLTTPTAIYAFDPGSGLDRWIYAPAKCSINGAALGSVGALISQTCTNPDCTGLKYCGAGPQLVLRDPTNGHSDDDAQKANPDQIKWIVLGNRDVPVSGDQLVSAIDPSTDVLDVFGSGKGDVAARLPLGTVTDPHRSVALATDTAEIIWLDGRLLAVDFSSHASLWSASAAGPPTLAPAPGQPSNTNALDQLQVVAPLSTGVELLAAATGPAGCPRGDCADQTIQVPGATGQRAYRFGTGFILAGTTTAVSQ